MSKLHLFLLQDYSHDLLFITVYIELPDIIELSFNLKSNLSLIKESS